ncbi:MAG: hypothetical protein LBL13_04015 [Bacteroidales bacterium]|jgi:hypothetical protein|nr:hypothetical protein [Bacteroidales bacterium]
MANSTVPLIVSVQARVDSFNRGVAAVKVGAEEMAQKINDVAQKCNVLYLVTGKTATALIRDFVVGCVKATSAIVTFIENTDIAIKKIAMLTGQVVDFAAHGLPVSDGMRLAMIGLATSLGAVAKAGLLILVFALVTSIMTGVSFSAALASVAANRLTNSIILLTSKAILFTGIPMLIAMAISAEIANQKIAALNGTLTPLQRATELLSEAWFKWSNIIAGSMLEPLAIIIGTISTALIMLADIVNAANDATGGWLLVGLKVVGTLMSMYAVMMSINIAWSMMKSVAVLKPIVTAIEVTIARLRSLFVAQTAVDTAQKKSNTSLATYIVLQIKATAVSMWNKVVATFGLVAGGIWSCAIATSKWILAQLGLNAVMSANPIFLALTLILSAIMLIVAGIAMIYTWWNSTADATAKSEERVKMLQKATEAYKNTLQDIVEEHKKILDYTNKVQEAAKTPTQKAADRAKQLQEAIDEPVRLQKQVDLINADIERKKNLMKTIRRKEDIEEIKKRIEEAQKTVEQLQKAQSKIKPMTATQKAFQEAENLKAEINDRDLTKYMPKITPSEELTRAINEINATKGLTEKVRQAMMSNAQKAFDEADETTKNVKKIRESLQKPIDKFYELSKQLESVKDKLSKSELAEAQKKYVEDLKSQLGVSKYLESSNSLINAQNNLSKVYENLIQYANATNMSDKQLAEAKRKAAKDILGQTEHAKLLYDAMDKLKPIETKIQEVQDAILANAKALRANGENITDEAIEKAMENAEEKIRSKTEKKKNDNQALVRGSVAYTDYTKKNTDTEYLKAIRDNAKKQTEYSKKTADAVTEMNSNKKEFEVIGN